MTIDATDVIAAARKIQEAEKALEWLRQHGKRLTGRDADEAAITVHLNLASSCPGAAEARSAMSRVATVNLPDVVTRATNDCLREINDQKTVIAQWIKHVESAQ